MTKEQLRQLAAAASGVQVTRIASVSREEQEARNAELARAERAARRAYERNEQTLIDERHEVIDHCGRSHFRNGLGEWIG